MHRDVQLPPGEDEIADLLLEMDANEVVEEDKPHKTTVEFSAVPEPAPQVSAPVRPPVVPPKRNASTADTAQKLLSRMARRDRT